MNLQNKPSNSHVLARLAWTGNDVWPLTISIAVIVVLFAGFAFRLPPVHDEATNHFPLAIQFMNSFPVFGDTYYSAYTPLAYIIVGNMMNVLGEHIWVARLYNLALGLFGLFGFRMLLKQLKASMSGWALLVLALSPYYLRNCVLFYMSSNATIFAIWGLALYLRAQVPWQYALAALSLGLASLSGQYALGIVAGIWLAEFVAMLNDSGTSTAKRSSRLQRLALLAVFQIPTLAVFLGWGGVTHATYRHHALAFSPAHVTGTLAYIGFAFIFLLMPRLRELGNWRIALLAATMLLLAWALPDFAIDQGPTSYPGLSLRLLGSLSRRAGMGSPFLLLPFAALGTACLALLGQNRSQTPLSLRFAVLLTSMSLMLSTEISESNASTVFPFILAFLAVEPPALLGRLALMAQSAFMGVAYVLYLVLFKFAHWY